MQRERERGKKKNVKKLKKEQSRSFWFQINRTIRKKSVSFLRVFKHNTKKLFTKQLQLTSALFDMRKEERKKIEKKIKKK